MRRSADARGKCKYVKARPEFSYSRCCPLPSLRRPAAFPSSCHCIALTRCNSFLSPRVRPSLPPLLSSHRPSIDCVRVHLPAALENATYVRTHAYTHARTPSRGVTVPRACTQRVVHATTRRSLRGTRKNSESSYRKRFLILVSASFRRGEHGFFFRRVYRVKGKLLAIHRAVHRSIDRSISSRSAP